MKQLNNEVIAAMEKSPLWIALNEKVKALYKKEGREATDEEYQAVRKMIIYKVMLEDEKVKETICKCTYEELKTQ